MKGKISNINKDTNSCLECIFCGGNKELSLVAHRHFISQSINGFVVVCQNCQNNKLKNNDWYFKIDYIKSSENISIVKKPRTL